MTAKAIGKWAENIACAYLQDQGLTLLHRNFYSRYGELDVIMLQDSKYLCFVEVRARHIQNYVTAIESIEYRKQLKTIQTAQVFLQKYPEYEQFFCRFDVITVEYAHTDVLTYTLQDVLADPSIQLQWIQHAYTL